MADKNHFAEVCERAGWLLTKLGKQAERNSPEDTQVFFERDAYQPLLDAIADVMKELANVTLMH